MTSPEDARRAEPGPQTDRRRRPLIGVAAVVLVAVLVCALLVRHEVAQPYRVDSGSMRPTLEPGDIVIVDRSERGRARAGEIVVLRGDGYLDDGTSGTRYWVKRVIGTGGDRLTCCDGEGRILRNGTPIAEPYLAPGTAPSAVAFDVRVKEGTVFVMGDARADSTDSRNRLGSPGGGMIPVDRVVGEVRRIVWPRSRAGEVAPIGSAR